MSHHDLQANSGSGHINRRKLVRGLALLLAPAIGASVVADAALARRGRKKAKRVKKHKAAGKQQFGGDDINSECHGGCK